MTTATVPDEFRRRDGRKAAIYIRQSTPDQVLNNKGSRAYQHAQRSVARGLGYPDELIEAYEDAGLTGSAADHREQYQRMWSDIGRHQVDLVIAADSSRITRDAEEWLKFTYWCAIHHVWLFLDGKLVDPRQGDARFVTGVVAMAHEYDNWRRAQTSKRGVVAKVKQGKAVTTPPAGYVWGTDGTWLKDERPGVQESIAAHYRALREGRSLRRAVALLRARGVETPRRLPKQGLGWSKPTISNVRRFVHHPAYVGDVAYGRRRGDPTLGRDNRGHFRTRRVPEGEVLVIRDHHEPYVSRDEQAALKAMLQRNAFVGPHGVLGPGRALAQGALICGKHGWRMSAVSKERAASGCIRFNYVCSGGLAEGGKRCGAIPGWVIDGLLLRVVIERLQPRALDEVAVALRDAEESARAEARRRHEMLSRLRREIDDLELRLSLVDPKHWTVARRYEEQLHERNLQLRAFDQGAERVPGLRKVTEQCLQELRALCSDLDGLLAAPTTEPRDRKELVRIIVERVTVEVRTRERVLLRITWNDGTADTLREALLSEYAHTMIEEWSSQGAEPGEIAARLTAQGVVTKYQTPWTAANVRRQRARARRNSAKAEVIASRRIG